MAAFIFRLRNGSSTVSRLCLSSLSFSKVALSFSYPHFSHNDSSRHLWLRKFEEIAPSWDGWLCNRCFPCVRKTHLQIEQKFVMVGMNTKYYNGIIIKQQSQRLPYCINITEVISDSYDVECVVCIKCYTQIFCIQTLFSITRLFVKHYPGANFVRQVSSQDEKCTFIHLHPVRRQVCVANVCSSGIYVKTVTYIIKQEHLQREQQWTLY